jgi:hypothetical protein
MYKEPFFNCNNRSGKCYGNTELKINRISLSPSKSKMKDVDEDEDNIVEERNRILSEVLIDYIPKSNTILLRELLCKNLPISDKKLIQRIDTYFSQ